MDLPNHRKILYPPIVLFLLLLLTACGGGSGGGDKSADPNGSGGGSDIVSGQNPDPVNDDTEPKLKITTAASNGGQISPSEVSLASGSSAKIELQPDPGFEIAEITGCPGTLEDSNTYQTEALVSDCLLTVEFRSTQKTLEISVFGDGVIDDGAGLICKRGDVCKHAYAQGTTVRLDATAAPGWELERWDGCANIEGSQCTLTLTEDTVASPAFTRSGEPNLHSNVVMLSDTDLSQLVSEEPGSLVFDISSGSIAGLEKDNILVSTQGQGFARRIIKVVELPNSPTFVQTANVPVSDIIYDSTINWSESIDASMVEGFEPAPNVRFKGIETRAKLLSLSVDIDLGKGVTASGELGLDLKPSVDLDLGYLRVDEFRMAMGAKVTSSLALSFRQTVDDMYAEREIAVGRLTLTPIAAGPVVFYPKLDVFMNLKGSVSTGIRLAGGVDVGGVFGTHFLRGSGRKTINSISAGGSWEKPEIDLTASLTKSTGTRLSLLLYGLAGPFVEVGPYMTLWSGLRGDLTGESSCYSWGGHFGGYAGIGGVVDLIGWKFKPEPVSIRVEGPSFGNNADVLTDSCKTPPRGAPQNIAAKQLGLHSAKITWESPIGDPAFHYALYRNGEFLKSVRGTEFADSGLNPGDSVCYSVRAIESDGDASVESDQACLKITDADTTPPTQPTDVSTSDITTAALTLSWSAANDNKAVSHYVVAQDGILLHRTSELSIRLTQLNADTEYCYEVSAVDHAGNESAKGEACEQTLPSGAGKWLMQIACEGQPYQLENNLDLDASNDGIINVLNKGNDYDGTRLTYTLSGKYDFGSSIFDAQITYAFEGHNQIRRDTFNADLSGNDTGNITMNQVEVTGCTAEIRFKRTTQSYRQELKRLDQGRMLFELW